MGKNLGRQGRIIFEYHKWYFFSYYDKAGNFLFYFWGDSSNVMLIDNPPPTLNALETILEDRAHFFWWKGKDKENLLFL